MKFVEIRNWRGIVRIKNTEIYGVEEVIMNMDTIILKLNEDQEISYRSNNEDFVATLTLLSDEYILIEFNEYDLESNTVRQHPVIR